MEQGLSKNMNEKIHLIKDVAIKDEQSLLGLVIQNTNAERTQRHTGFIFIKNNRTIPLKKEVVDNFKKVYFSR